MAAPFPRENATLRSSLKRRLATAAGVVLLAVTLAAGIACPHARASVLELEQVVGPLWSAHKVRLEFDFVGSQPALRLTIAELFLPAGLGTASALAITCPHINVSAERVECPRGHLQWLLAGQQRQADGQLVYHVIKRRLELTVPATPTSPTALSLTVTLSPASPAFEAHGTAIGVPDWMSQLRGALPALADFDVSAGLLDFSVQAAGGEAPVIGAQLNFTELAFNNRSGEIASDALALQIDLDAHSKGNTGVQGAWAGSLAVAFERGGVYAQPVYIDLGQYPFEARTEFAYNCTTQKLHLREFTMLQPGVVALHGSLESTPQHRIGTLFIEADGVQFPAAYDTWLASVMVGTPLAALDTGGQARGRLEMRNDQTEALAITLEALHVEDRGGRFALYGLTGAIQWTRSERDIGSSELSLDGGFVYGAGFESTRFELGIAGAAIDLLEPARIPLLGGALVVKNFSLRNYGSDDVALGLEAELEPIDLGQLTLALNWPAFSGDVSGRLPLLRYHNGVVTVGGALEAHAFDGDIRVEQLRIEQPFGAVPSLSANIRLRNLDLERVTEVVPFGRVSGRLEGDIDGLRLLKGQPVAFDAHFRTPEDDDSRHQLSQRAVDTITRAAGGSAAISTTFLRVFKNFAYDKLGISCRLDNDVCHMDGIESTDGGYYIVKGAFIPRVDLIGRVRNVHWSRLIQQLRQALNEGEFKIE